MTTLLRKAVKLYREEGFIRLLTGGIRFGYETAVRPLLPKTTVSYNGVQVRNGDARLGDFLVPWHTTAIPGYEEALIRSIREHAKSGDRVAIVGGGWGVSTVAAARCVGEVGSVVTFEGSESAVKNVKKTINLNNVGEQVVVRHAIVSQAHSLRGEKGEAAIISPEDLPECEVLVLDCEGAEKEILKEIEITPRIFVVETHGMFDAPSEEIKKRIESRGYSITDLRVAEERQKEFCEENDIYVVTAVNSEKSD